MGEVSLCPQALQSFGSMPLGMCQCGTMNLCAADPQPSMRLVLLLLLPDPKLFHAEPVYGSLYLIVLQAVDIFFLS